MPSLRLECRLGSCRARMGHLNVQHSVRPSQDSVYTCGEREDETTADDNEEDIDKLKSAERAIIEEEGEETEEGAKTIRGKRRVCQPPRDEYEEHMGTHIPFRKQCPHCVKGKRQR